MSAEYIVRFCSPTLAGIKLGSLFSCRYDQDQELSRFVREQDRLLAPRGVRLVLVKKRAGLALIYVYRSRQLAALLREPAIQEFLRGFGYTDFRVAACLFRLRARLVREDFPHDIGIFLGYPLSDVRAFIRHQGKNCPCTGYWKAYTNILQAQRTFRSYRMCTESYCQHFSAGMDIARLTVAG